MTMKKLFLTLMLMALLPLAGWADNTTVTLYDFTVPYGTELTVGNLPDDAWQVTGELDKEAVKEYLTFARVDDGSATWNSNNVGVYSWTLTKAANTEGHTIYLSSNNAKLTIAKVTTNAISTPPVQSENISYADLVDIYQGSYALVSTPGAATFGDVEYIASDTEPAENAAEWSTDFPVAEHAGTYNVWYRVQETNNYNGIAITKLTALSPVKVVGGTPTWSVDPAAVTTDLTYTGASQALITPGTVTEGEGTPWYKLGNDGEWIENIAPEATNAGDYTIYYKIVGAEGYESTDGTTFVTKSIGAATPSITDPTGPTTSLTYNGEAQALLSAAATEALNAPILYDITYKAPDADDFSAFVSDKAYADVKATNAGTYRIVAKVSGQTNFANGNSGDVDVIIAQKEATLPTAITGLTYDGQEHALINAGEADIVEYSFEGAGYTTSTAGIVGTAGKTYTVKYKVTNPNYVAVDETTLPNVKIAKALLTIKVKDVTKTYDATTDIPAITAANMSEKLQFITSVPGYVTTGIAYKAIPAGDEDINKKVGTKEDVVTVDKTTFIGLDEVNKNYDVSIVPGDLIVNPAELYVTANNQDALTTSMSDIATYTLGTQYTVTGIVGTEDPWATGQAPVLTSDAPATIIPGNYTLSFTPGTLKEGGNYTMRAENPYVIAEGLQFVVTPEEGSKVVITVAPHSKVYGDSDPNFAEWEEGEDYFVSGLAAGDEIQNLTFTRAEGETVADGPYALEVTATVKNPTWYDEPIAFNNSTFTINPAELTATVNQQVVLKGATALPDGDAWNVEGLVNNEDKSVLNGVLTLAGATDDATLVENGIKLTIDNPNYTFVANEVNTNDAYGNLLVIESNDFVVDDADANLLEKIQAAAAKGTAMNVKIKFAQRDRTLSGARTWAADNWSTLTLPFNITVRELSQIFGYAVVNVVNPEGYTTNEKGAPVYKFNLTMKGGNGSKEYLPANKPFVIKTTDALNDWIEEHGTEGYLNFGSRIIVAPTEEDFAGVDAGGNSTFKPAYAKKEVSSADKGNIWFLMGNYTKWAYIKESSPNKWNIVPFEGFIDQSTTTAQDPQAAIFVMEELDGTTTAIKGVEIEETNSLQKAEGWYNLNGMKLMNAPTQKGVYIQNGKKVIIK